MKLPPLKALTYFNAAASQESFKAAAIELSITEGAISRQIKRLEDYCGHLLFERIGRGVRLTDKGVRLFSASLPALQQIADATEGIRCVDQQLNLTVTTSFAIRWLMPKLTEFEKNYPEYPINLQAGKSPRNTNNVGFDARIVYQLGDPFRPDNVPPENAEIIMAEWLQPMCSPSLLPNGEVLSLADLQHHKIILNEPTGRDWRLWLKSMPDIKLNFNTAIGFEHDDTAIQAAIAGHGITLANQAYVTDELKNGALVPAINMAPKPIGAHYLISDAGCFNSPKVKAFRGWLLSKAEK